MRRFRTPERLRDYKKRLLPSLKGYIIGYHVGCSVLASSKLDYYLLLADKVLKPRRRHKEQTPAWAPMVEQMRHELDEDHALVAYTFAVSRQSQDEARRMQKALVAEGLDPTAWVKATFLKRS
jgi:hypothetical protein